MKDPSAFTEVPSQEKHVERFWKHILQLFQHWMSISEMDWWSPEALMALSNFGVWKEGNVRCCRPLLTCKLSGRCVDSFNGFSDGKVMITHVAPTHEYWVIGRNGQISVLDPKGPVDITDSIPGSINYLDGSSLRMNMIYAPPSCELLLGATKDNKIVIWKYQHTRAHRWL